MRNNRSFRHFCLRCRKPFVTPDITDYYCSQAHREAARKAASAEKVPLKFNRREAATWKRNLARFEKPMRRRAVSPFGKQVKFTTPRRGVRNEQPVASDPPV